MTEPLNIAIAAGGTGGHMFPAEALAQELQSRGHKVFLLSDARGLSYPGIFKDMQSHCIESGTYSRQHFAAAVKSIWQICRGFRGAYGTLKRQKPDVLVGFGGYPMVPAVAAACALGIPYCLHEQNSVLGRANRLLQHKADAIALSFTATKRLAKRSQRQAVITGNPVRHSIAQLTTASYPQFAADHDIAILVIGGSLGSKVLSDVVPHALALLPQSMRRRLLVTHQCRAEDFERVSSDYQQIGIKAEVFSFIENIPDYFHRTHLIIARAGATTICEAMAAGRPVILVPLSSALDDHQTENAKHVVKAGGGWMLAEKEFSVAALGQLILQLFANPERLQTASKAALSLGAPLASVKLADLVENTVVARRSSHTHSAEPGGKLDRGAIQKFCGMCS